jgi:glycyl-tRNA synthetase beta chain
MAELLLELFSEEMPASMQQGAKDQLLAQILAGLKERFGLELQGHAWVTPRRLGVFIDNLPLEIKESKEELRGPKIAAPEQALEGFLRKNNINKERLEKRGEYYYAIIARPAAAIREVLGKLIEEVLLGFSWPKSMRWSDHEIKWVRPLHNILCLLDSEILALQFGHIRSNNLSFGHRFMAKDQISISNFSDYKSKLAQAFVILESNDRKQAVLTQVNDAIAAKELAMIEDSDLLSEIAGLVEYPVVLLGEIGEEYMKLPREVLVITLRHHQRYLMLNDLKGNLAPYFIIVANRTTADKGDEIVRGNIKVLNARLEDARFFYTGDKAHSLVSRVDELKGLTFHKEIGTIYDKMQSTKAMVERICTQLKIESGKAIRAVELSKTDLVTGMVKEFPELQGIMGYYYALNDNEDKEVAIAIRDHYKPQGPSDSLPENLTGALAALADKLDTLNQMFEIGIKPTGSKDPYALRRAAIGVLRILAHYELNLDLANLGLRDDVCAFINERKNNLSL